MKLAEALLTRVDLTKKIDSLNIRLINNAKVQQGCTPSEDPEELLHELDKTMVILKNIIQEINKANATTHVEGYGTLSDMLVQRDTILKKRNILTSVVDNASDLNSRYSNSEILVLSTIDVKKYRKEIDDLSAEYRKLDSKIQEINWTIDLV